MKACVFTAAVAFSLVLAGSSTAAGTLRAGWAHIDITPTEPVTLAGYSSRKEVSRGVHDPLAARVLAFESGGQRLVLVSTDNLGFYAGTVESTRAAILEACKLKPAELFLCAIHTHSAPSLTLDEKSGHPNNVRYTRGLQGRLVEVVRTALEGLAPAELGFGSGSSPVGVNRRETVREKDGTTRIVLGRNPGGPCDPEVQVLKVAAAGGTPAAVLFAYATHSTSLGPKNLIVSGDVHGLAEQFVEKNLGADLIAPGFAGASGDIDPWYRVLPGFNTNNGWMPETVLMGTMLGEEVAVVSQRLACSPDHGPVRGLMRTLQLPGKGTEAASAPFNVTVGRVGEIAFVGLGGEVFSQIGKAIKSGSPFRHTLIFTHCNGTAGYVPTAPSYPEGGYEVQSSRFGPAAADQLARETVNLLRVLESARD